MSFKQWSQDKKNISNLNFKTVEILVDLVQIPRFRDIWPVSTCDVQMWWIMICWETRQKNQLMSVLTTYDSKLKENNKGGRNSFVQVCARSHHFRLASHSHKAGFLIIPLLVINARIADIWPSIVIIMFSTIVMIIMNLEWIIWPGSSGTCTTIIVITVIMLYHCYHRCYHNHDNDKPRVDGIWPGSSGMFTTQSSKTSSPSISTSHIGRSPIVYN